MNINVERLPECRATMRVEVAPGDVQAERQRVTQLFASKAKIPGFRPGKAPRHVIEKRYQKEIQEELQERLIRRGFQEGIDQEKLDVLRITRVQNEEFHLDDSFSFVAQLQTAPEFTLPEYDSIPVTAPRIEISPEEIDAELDHLRQRLARFEDVTDRPIAMDDFAVLDFQTELEGRPLGEVVEDAGQLARAEGQWMRLSEDTFLPGFCAALAGMNPSDHREFDLEIDPEFPITPIQGKTLTFKVDLKAIKTQVLPEWTDELAAQLGEGLTLETLRKTIADQLEQEQEKARRESMTTQILEFFDRQLDFELPASVVNEETQRHVNEMVYQGHLRGLTEDQISQNQDAIIRHASSQAEVSVKTSFILRQIAESEKIDATEKEILSYCAHLAQANNTPLKKYLSQVRKQNALGTIADRIVRAKTLDFLREKASMNEVDRSEFEERVGEPKTE